VKEIVYHVATSLDGFIAHSDGSIDGFAMDGPHLPDYLNALKNYAVAIMGRKTYEFGYSYGLQPGQNPYPNMETYVFSSSLQMPEDGLDGPPEIHTVREDFIPRILELKKSAKGPIYLCGGGQFAGLLMQEALVDRLILKLNPVTFGSGLPLWGTESGTINHWKVMHQKVYENGVMLLEYSRL
tara:strand:+ start:227 stop:775 length:549 start_codon:yes stop_codon:yes gene_type:complete